MSWWADLYDDDIADLLLDGADERETARAVEFLVAHLGLAPGDRVFDQCAGTGRLSVPLAAHGLEVVAVEQAPSYVERARVAAITAGVAAAARFEVGDAFEFVADPPCRGALNWWTGFGYLPDDEGNMRMLRRALESLAPGGAYALDFLNMPGVLRSFRPREVTTRGALTLTRDTTLDLARGVMRKRWRVERTQRTGRSSAREDSGATSPERARTRESAVRAYYPHELAALLGRVGFVDVELFGGTGGEPLELDSPRCIAVARRA